MSCPARGILLETGSLLETVHNYACTTQQQAVVGKVSTGGPFSMGVREHARNEFMLTRHGRRRERW